MNFLSKAEVLELQHDQIEDFGGTHGLRDDGAFESALMAPHNRLDYEQADEVKCAATYGYHLSQTHAFIDGNKRVAAAAMLVFLDSNGFEVEASLDELIALFLQLASGEVNRDQLEQFLRERIIQI